ncbi:peptidase associated/transthyretin-like domain-containing protein [Deinococcus aetherius]|uniref:PEGA domain-containing protein n=1 Tax=Deinococcus aetherius TaxID=200252 RepID=UPI00223213E6|nr:PEGA domain-containing protein [Deinococcus aetherius]
MKPIGPYVAARDLTGELPGGEVRTFRATDRLTGMPVLLHVLSRVVILPELPHDPALLPFTDSGVDGETVYLATELAPHAVPASDPLLAARGALAGLAALHDSGLTHGGVGPAQLWSVDGRVALAGAGLPWGRGNTPQDDLRDLAATLERLGGIPRSLQDASESLSARELLARLSPSAAPPPTPPAEAPASTDHHPGYDGTPIVLGEADSGEGSPPEPRSPGRKGGKGRGSWRLPNLGRSSGVGAGPETGPPPASPEPGPVDQPVTVQVPAVPPVVEPVAPEVPRVVRLGSGGEGPAREGAARGERPALTASPAREVVAAPPPLVDINLGEADLEALAADQQDLASLRESLRETAGLPPEPDSLIAAAIRHQAEGRPRPAASGGTTPRRVVDKPVRIGWEDDHSWRVVRTGQSAPPRSRSVPRWLGPALALAALLLLVALVWVLLAARGPRADVRSPQARVAGACCDVRFTVRGGAGVPVRLSVVSAPEGSGVSPGAAVGTVPGPVRLPGPGTYTLRVAAEGYSPSTVTITAPTAQPIAIDLGL